MLDLLQNVDPADVLTFARRVPTPDDFLLTREIVPETQINNVKYRIKSSSRYRGTAKFRAYDTETPYGRREVDHSILEGMLPPVGQKLRVGELETILLALARGADDQDLIDEVFDDTEANVRAIQARMELAAGDLLVDGIFTLLDENGLTLEADFEVPAGNLPTAPTYWSDPAALILDQERAWVDYLIAQGEGRPGDAMASAQVIAFLAKNQQYKEDFYGRNQTSYPTLTEGQVASVRAQRRLPTIREYDTQVRVDGVNRRVTPANRYFMLPSDKRSFAETQYGITAEAIALSRGNGPGPRIVREDLPGIVVTATEKDDPVAVVTKGSAVAMPVMYAPKAYICARVLA